MTSSLETISTFIDIVALIPQLYDEDKKEFIWPESEIRSHIVMNDAQLRSQLKHYISTDLTTTPRVGIPLPRKGNEGNGKLLLVKGTDFLTVADKTGVYSQVYTILFISNDAFEVESDLSGVQGTGATTIDFTTTDTYLSIDKDLWKGNFVKGDVHYVRVYAYEGMLVHLSALLTAKYILDTIYVEEVPDASAASQKFERLYNRLIKAIQDGKIFLEKGLVSINLDPIQQDYEIDVYGRDITNYQDFEWEPIASEL